MEVQGPGESGAVIPAEVPQYYLPLRGSIPTGPALVYQAGVLAAATVNFVSTGSGASTLTRIRRVAPAPESALAIDWDRATALEPTLEDLDRQPASGATLAPPTPAMTKVVSYRSWGTDFSDWAFRTQTMEILKSPSLGVTSNAGETEADFRNRLLGVATAKQSEAVDKLKKQYDAKKQTLSSQLLRAQQARERESEQSRGRWMQTAISFGATVLAGVFGRKKLGTSTLGRATTAMRDVGRSMDQAGDVKRADQTLASLQQKLTDLDAQQQSETDALTAKIDPLTENLEKILMRPRKSDITVDALGLVWMPYWKDASGNMTPTWS
jgi:Sec-independent protein translocase protein TatA